MWVDYADLNQTSPKDFYFLPNINKMVDIFDCYKLFSIMDLYFRYNQIHRHELRKEKTTFMTKHANYKYNVMPFRLKNLCAI